MKKLILLITVATLFVACDKIEGPYAVPDQVDAVTIVFPPLDPTTVYRKVLIEEYTGHRCPNCPGGHQQLETLHGIFGDTLIPVAIHATTLAAPNPEFPNDFRTEAGNELANFYSIDGIPAAIINRGFEAGGWGPARWQSKINAVDRSHVYAAIQLMNQYNMPSPNILKVNAKVTMLEDYAEPLRLSLFLVEDGVVSPQINGTEVIPDYVHNHMLRTAINGVYGDFLAPNGILEKGNAYTYGYSIDFNGKNWNPDNCFVIAILYDKENNEVLQVERLKVR
ncbi:MAG: Omp28 family outer membrane lipoprotein [Bacteroidales bacterium]|nr:Omp28 family outer membrane lipoprotein [Bacteroidales bacterium]